MFLELLKRRNPKLIDAAITLHQQGYLPANCYVLDLDAIEDNSRAFAEAAGRLGLTVFAMTKQIGRHSGACKAMIDGGISSSVAVDMACAVATHRAGMNVGHLGHLVQVPRSEADLAAKQIAPDFWTVFSLEKAAEAAGAALRAGRVQALMARVHAQDDIFYRGHEGGFDHRSITEVADAFDKSDGSRFAGVTTFPAMLFDNQKRKVVPTPNLGTLARTAETLASTGRTGFQINAPGTTSTAVLQQLADAGATQCEPGNGLHGTTPLHALQDLPEDPAVAYLTEVSHHFGGRAYCFGGGLYVDPVFPDYAVHAVVGSEPDSTNTHSVEMPTATSIDYYAMIDCSGPRKPRAGDSVVFGFRGQAFVTRAWVAGIRGIKRGKPEVTTIENVFGEARPWPALV